MKKDITITLKTATSCGSLPRFTAEFRGVRWTFASCNDGTIDDLQNEAMLALARFAISAGRGSDANQRRFGSEYDYVEII